MLSIKEFFKKIQKTQGKELFVRTVIKDAIQKHAGIDLPIESISFKSNSLIVQDVSSSARSVLYIKKHAIIDEINSQQNVRVITDLR